MKTISEPEPADRARRSPGPGLPGAPSVVLGRALAYTSDVPIAKDSSEATGYSKAEVERLLSALSEQAAEIVAVIQRVLEGAVRSAFQEYNTFRDAISEFEAFCILIEHRLKNLRGGEEDPRLKDEFEQLRFLIYRHQIDAALRLLAALSQSDALPLGSKFVFTNELRSVAQTRALLDDPRWAARIDGDMRRKLDKAAEILDLVISRAPALLELDRRS